MLPPQDSSLQTVYNESVSPLHDELYPETSKMRSIFAKRLLRVTLVVFMTIIYGELQPERNEITTEGYSFSQSYDIYSAAWAATLLNA